MNRTISDRITLVLLPLSAVLMEVFWGYPWLIWTGKWETLHWYQSPLGILELLALVAISFLVTRFLTNKSWPSYLIKLSIIGIGLIVVFLVIRIEYGNGIAIFSGQWFAYIGQLILESFSNFNRIVLAFPVAAYFWWRGMLLGRKRDYNYIQSNIIFGAASFLALGFIWWGSIGTESFSEMATTIGPYAAAFFFFGLAGTALNNLRNVQKRMPQEEAQPVSYGHWLPFIFTTVAVIIGTGSIIATAASLDIGKYIKRFFNALSGIMETVLLWLAVPFEYILMPFEWLARTIIEWLVSLFGVNSIEPDMEAGMNQELPEVVPGTTPEEWLTLIKWLLFIIVFIVVTILIARSIQKNRINRSEATSDSELTHESLWNWRLLITGLLSLFRKLFSRFLPKRLAARPAVGISELRQVEHTVTTLKIREVFRHLLRDAAKRGINRKHSETPFEYAQRFVEEIPDAGSLMHELTQLYVHVRYSNTNASASQVARANNIWQKLKVLLKTPAAG